MHDKPSRSASASNTASTLLDSGEPLVVRPRDACRLLSVGNTRLYELIGAGELDSYRDGRGRRITVESIRRYIDRRLAASGTSSPEASASTPPRRRGRPPKARTAEGTAP